MRTLFSLNIEKAKELLARPVLKVWKSTSAYAKHKSGSRSRQSLQNTFAQAGIKLNIRWARQSKSWAVSCAELDMYMGAWGPDYPDPHTNAGTFAYNPDNSDEATPRAFWHGVTLGTPAG